MIPDPCFFTVPEDAPRQRLDVWLSHQEVGISRTRLQSLMAAGCIHVNDQPCQPAQKIQPGDQISVTIPPAEDPIPQGENLAFTRIYEDADILVLDKPPGMVVHPAPGHSTGTLVNALIHHCGHELSGIGGVKRPGIVHRLDKGTSGLMVVAKNDQAHQSLMEQFATRTLSRCYTACVVGVPHPLKGTVESLIGRHPRDRKKMAVRQRGGKQAITHYSHICHMGTQVSVVTCQLETGRTHQIRVHMHSLGHGLVGDGVYEPAMRLASPQVKEVHQAFKAMERPLLHAHELCLQHPKTHELRVFNSPIPQDFAQALTQLGLEVPA